MEPTAHTFTQLKNSIEDTIVDLARTLDYLDTCAEDDFLRQEEILQASDIKWKALQSNVDTLRINASKIALSDQGQAYHWQQYCRDQRTILLGFQKQIREY